MKKSLVLISSLVLTLSGCNFNISSSEEESKSDTETSSMVEDESSSANSSSSKEQSSSQSSSSQAQESSSSDSGITVNEDFVFPGIGGNATVESMSKLASYTPITFKASTYQKTTSSLGTGVDLNKCTFNLNNDAAITAYCVEVDLSKADVKAGSYNNTTSPTSFMTTSVPVSQANAWESDNSGKKVMAVTNADFFGSTTVNAFVKDGVILKNAHNDDAGDVPVSSPMLFGVSTSGARIGAMTTTNNHLKDYTTALTYGSELRLYQEDGSLIETLTNGVTDGGSNVTYSVCTLKDKAFYFSKGQVYTFKIIQDAQGDEGEVRACITKAETISKTTKYKIEEDGIGYFATNANMNVSYEVGTYMNLIGGFVQSPEGGIWNYYDTIIGCRHSLVENGSIPATVAEESSNGAKARVPRTAVGIKDDGKVVIVSIEDLHYGGKATTCTGLTLSQLADFMRYYGCYDAANFDGGGSSQLCTKDGSNGMGAWKVVTKSSDTGSTTPTSTRKVMNTIMVTTK